MERFKFIIEESITVNADEDMEGLMYRELLSDTSINQILNANNNLNNSSEFRNLIAKYLDSNAKDEDFTISAFDYNTLLSKGGRLADFYAPNQYSYKVQIIKTSVIYTCLNVINENSFLCYQSLGSEIKLLKKLSGSKMFIKD